MNSLSYYHRCFENLTREKLEPLENPLLYSNGGAIDINKFSPHLKPEQQDPPKMKAIMTMKAQILSLEKHKTITYADQEIRLALPTEVEISSFEYFLKAFYGADDIVSKAPILSKLFCQNQTKFLAKFKKLSELKPKLENLNLETNLLGRPKNPQDYRKAQWAILDEQEYRSDENIDSSSVQQLIPLYLTFSEHSSEYDGQKQLKEFVNSFAENIETFGKALFKFQNNKQRSDYARARMPITNLDRRINEHKKNLMKQVLATDDQNQFQLDNEDPQHNPKLRALIELINEFKKALKNDNPDHEDLIDKIDGDQLLEEFIYPVILCKSVALSTPLATSYAAYQLIEGANKIDAAHGNLKIDDPNSILKIEAHIQAFHRLYNLPAPELTAIVQAARKANNGVNNYLDPLSTAAYSSYTAESIPGSTSLSTHSIFDISDLNGTSTNPIQEEQVDVEPNLVPRDNKLDLIVLDFLGTNKEKLPIYENYEEYTKYYIKNILNIIPANSRKLLTEEALWEALVADQNLTNLKKAMLEDGSVLKADDEEVVLMPQNFFIGEVNYPNIDHENFPARYINSKQKGHCANLSNLIYVKDAFKGFEVGENGAQKSLQRHLTRGDAALFEKYQQASQSFRNHEDNSFETIENQSIDIELQAKDDQRLQAAQNAHNLFGSFPHIQLKQVFFPDFYKVANLHILYLTNSLQFIGALNYYINNVYPCTIEKFEGIELKQAPNQAHAEQANLSYSNEIRERKQAWKNILQYKLQAECYYTIIVTRKCGDTQDEHQLLLYKTKLQNIDQNIDNGFILYDPNFGFRFFEDATTLATLMTEDTNVHKKFTIIDQKRLLEWYKGYELAKIKGEPGFLRSAWSYPAASIKSTIEMTHLTYHSAKKHYYISTLATLALCTTMLKNREEIGEFISQCTAAAWRK